MSTTTNESVTRLQGVIASAHVTANVYTENSCYVVVSRPKWVRLIHPDGTVYSGDMLSVIDGRVVLFDKHRWVYMTSTVRDIDVMSN